MKRAGKLYDQICDPDNLRMAFVKAKRGKEKKPDVYAYSKSLTVNLRNLRGQLLSGDYDVGNYNFFKIYEPKERLICAAPFAERVLHHAIINVCHPIFERHQIEHSYATRIGKGQYAALEYAKTSQKKHAWFCKLDIRKYFDSISHEILINFLGRQFKDQKLLGLFEKIIHSYQSITSMGLPIGNLTSQYFANFYLSIADHYFLEKIHIPSYTRYMDDMVFWHRNQNTLLEKSKEYISFIEEKLELRVKPVCLHSTEKGLPFLGYVVFPGYLRLNTNSKKRFIQKMKIADKFIENGRWSQEEFAIHVKPLIAFTEHADAFKLRQKILN
jgi:retron-type reverse transcriptase